MSQQKILIVEDDKEMNEIISLYLTKNSFKCFQAFNGKDALMLARQCFPDLMILDVQLPELDGISVCRTLRQETDIPILFLSCCTEERDKILGLEVGGDDYIAKPFSLAELQARIKAALRRKGLPDMPSGNKQILEFPGLTIHLQKSLVILDDSIIDLTLMEFQLLARLARTPGWTFTSEQLFSLVWGEDSIDTRTVAVHINRLRKKLGKNSAKIEYITTVWGKGYQFNHNV